MFRQLMVATSCALLNMSSASAATPPPPLPFDSVTETLKSKPITRLLLGRFVISLEVTSLPSVQNAIGIGSMSYRGDGAAAESWLCYTLNESVPHGRLWIISNAEMGGPEMLVDGIRAQLGDGVGATADCPSLPKRFQPITFDHAIWLGTRKASIRSLFGSASKVIGNWQQYYYLGKTRDDGKCAPDGYDVLNGFAINIEGGIITDINAGQVTSC
jgi:hypothetical protein